MIRNYIWYNKKLDLQNFEAIHQVLAFGELSELRELEQKLTKPRLKEIFIDHPSKIYRPASFNFIKNYILKIERPVDEKKYLKDTLRNP